MYGTNYYLLLTVHVFSADGSITVPVWVMVMSAVQHAALHKGNAWHMSVVVMAEVTNQMLPQKWGWVGLAGQMSTHVNEL